MFRCFHSSLNAARTKGREARAPIGSPRGPQTLLFRELRHSRWTSRALLLLLLDARAPEIVSNGWRASELSDFTVNGQFNRHGEETPEQEEAGEDDRRARVRQVR